MSPFLTVSVRVNVLNTIGSTQGASKEQYNHREESCPNLGMRSLQPGVALPISNIQQALRAYATCLVRSTRDAVPNPSRENHGHGVAHLYNYWLRVHSRAVVRTAFHCSQNRFHKRRYRFLIPKRSIVARGRRTTYFVAFLDTEPS